ncbi:SCA7, zinc-binding domain-containing protein, partial [Mycena leptocephala]
TKGPPVDYDQQCGVINDMNLPCSRSLVCKSHSMGAKRAVQGRSRNYDDLLIDWQRQHNPYFVEPVRRETRGNRS